MLAAVFWAWGNGGAGGKEWAAVFLHEQHAGAYFPTP